MATRQRGHMQETSINEDMRTEALEESIRREMRPHVALHRAPWGHLIELNGRPLQVRIGDACYNLVQAEPYAMAWGAAGVHVRRPTRDDPSPRPAPFLGATEDEVVP